MTWDEIKDLTMKPACPFAHWSIALVKGKTHLSVTLFTRDMDAVEFEVLRHLPEEVVVTIHLAPDEAGRTERDLMDWELSCALIGDAP